jgi:hypothetical protein
MATTKVIPDVLDLNATGADKGLKMPSGTSSNQPTEVSGIIRNNTAQSNGGSSSSMEYYNGSNWKVIVNCTTNVLDIFGDGSCIAAYTLDGNVNDLSNNYNGTPTSITYGAGKYGQAAVFNGSSSNISLPTSIKPSNSIMSVSIWASDNSTARKSIFYLEYSDAPAFLSLENNSFTDSTALSVLYNNTAVITPAGSTLPADGSWHHIVVTASATEVKLYKNGSQIGSTASVTVNTNALTAANIGVRDFNNDLYWDGKIDQVRIFNKELSASEVTTLYNEVAC